MINDIAEKLWAAIQRPSPAVSKEEIAAILREGLDAPTADESASFEFEPTEAYKDLLAEAEAAERRHAYKAARDGWLETGLLHEGEPLYRKAIDASPDA